MDLGRPSSGTWGQAEGSMAPKAESLMALAKRARVGRVRVSWRPRASEYRGRRTSSASGGISHYRMAVRFGGVDGWW